MSRTTIKLSVVFGQLAYIQQSSVKKGKRVLRFLPGRGANVDVPAPTTVFRKASCAKLIVLQAITIPKVSILPWNWIYPLRYANGRALKGIPPKERRLPRDFRHFTDL
jgi:hypothetical protein